jgi:hypothetical protein
MAGRSPHSLRFLVGTVGSGRMPGGQANPALMAEEIHELSVPSGTRPGCSGSAASPG